MKIAVVAHIRHAIAEPYPGGMEAHAALLCRGLREAGHEVVLFAAAGSADEALVPVCAQPYEAVLPWARWRGTEALGRFQQQAFDTAWAHIAHGAFDVVHNNSLFPGLITRAAEAGVPMVTSQHVPPFGGMRDAVREVAGCDRAQITVTSASQLPLWFARPPGNVTVAYNGVDCTRWRPAGERSGRLLWSGRITPNKGLREAIVAVRLDARALDIVGPVEDEGYFAAHVAPFLGGRIAYHGHVGGGRLAAMVAAAEAMLVTPMWDEPFGLVAAEALASAVPVVAFDRGAMREVVGECGMLVAPGDCEALAAALGRIGGIDRTACRRRALERFSVPAMIARYEWCYAAAIRGAESGVGGDWAGSQAGSGGSNAASRSAARASSSSITRALLAKG